MVIYRDLRYMLETLLHTKLMFGGWVVDIHMPEKRPSSNLKSNSPQSVVAQVKLSNFFRGGLGFMIFKLLTF